MSSLSKYTVISENDNSLKQFFDRFYVIPKDFSIISPEDRKIIEKYKSELTDKLVSAGKDGYIVFRGNRSKKLNAKQIEEIKADNVSSQRKLALKYNCSHATINKIKNNKY